MNDANKPCYCGSGKKTKKCHPNERKPRTTEIIYNLGEMRTVNKIDLNTLTGEAKFYFDDNKFDIESANLSLGYERPTKRKSLNKIPLAENKFTLSADLALLDFDLLLAIDTNTVKINQNTLSVSCLVAGKIEKVADRPFNKQLNVTTLNLIGYEPPTVIAMWNVAEKPENLGWMTLIEAVLRSAFYNKDLKIGLIVDSDYGNLESFNKRELPIYNNFFLPQNMKMIYASSDSGSEYAVNKLIRIADSTANKLTSEAIELSETGKFDEFLGSKPVENQPYTHFRILITG